MLSSFFQNGPIPPDQIIGYYEIKLVILSYVVATIASYIALDITGRLRDVDNTRFHLILWLVGGGFAMGAGIWSMHFIGMLAFRMPMQMSYDPFLTILSLVVAIIASTFALFLVRKKEAKIGRLAIGGIILGLAISTMHYTGMAAMTISMNIHYLFGLFSLSVLIAIIASEAALWLALKSNEQGTLKVRIRLKIVSALIMGAAICGMHYTGMAAAVFTPKNMPMSAMHAIDPNILSFSVAMIALVILSIAFIASTYKEVINYQIIKFARKAGMAEVASNVLHNIGNVLNSVNISSSIITDHVTHSKLSGLSDLYQLIDEHKQDLGNFILHDPKGSNFLTYLKALSDYWKNEQTLLVSELETLNNSVEYIKKIIAMQQTLAGVTKIEEAFSIDEILEEALALMNIDSKKYNISVKKEYQNINQVVHDKAKLMQVVINLIQNAKDALLESSCEHKVLYIKTQLNAQQDFYIQFIDNGIGIPKENLTKIFSYGFTTKKTGHGFGLHASALALAEMGGSIEVASEGIEKGATFTVTLPYKQHKEL